MKQTRTDFEKEITDLRVLHSKLVEEDMVLSARHQQISQKMNQTLVEIKNLENELLKIPVEKMNDPTMEFTGKIKHVPIDLIPGITIDEEIKEK